MAAVPRQLRDLKYVKGMSTVNATLGRLTEGKSVERLTRAMNKGGEEIADTARSLVPIDDGVLRASIGHEIVPVSRVSKKTGDLNLAAAVHVYAGDDRAFYAKWVEFGTPPHSTSKGLTLKKESGRAAGKGHPGARARPFFFPAYRIVKKRVRNRIKRELRKLVKEIMNGR